MPDLRKAAGGERIADHVIPSWPRLRLEVRKRYRGLTLVVAAALTSIAAVISGGQAPLIDGTLYDLAAIVHNEVLSSVHNIFFAHRVQPEPVVLIALDRDSLASEKFKSLPRTYLGNWLGEMTKALFAADARIVGFDILFGYSPPESTHHDRKLKDAVRNNRSRIVAIRTLQTQPADEWIAAFYDPSRDAAADRNE